MLGDDAAEAVKAFAHVGRLAAQIIPAGWAEVQHAFRIKVFLENLLIPVDEKPAACHREARVRYGKRCRMMELKA